MLTPTQELNEMLTLIKKYHSHQTRSPSNIPYWHHLVSVAEILDQALAESQEIEDKQQLANLRLAALGHDLYEDTTVKPAEIQEKFGQSVDQLIQGMTNQNGDRNRTAYVQQIIDAPDEVKLIKLADLTENTLSASQRQHELGSEWTTSFFLPIIEEMSPNVEPKKFKKYRQTAAILWTEYQFAYRRLIDNLAKFQ